MPPSNGPAKGRKAAATKQPTKPVIPALPLKRRPAPLTTVVKDKPAATSNAQEIAAISETSQTKHHDNVNGEVQDAVAGNVTASPPSDSQHQAEPLPTSQGSGSGESGANEHVLTATAASEFKATTDHASDVMDSDQKPNGIAPSERSIVDAPTADVTEDELASETLADSKRALSKNALMQKPVDYNAVQVAKSLPPPGMSPSRYQMPPPFQPANRSYAAMNINDVSRDSPVPLPNGPGHMHHAQPSNSSIHFGALQDSQSPSPAPPQTGGMAPPPGIATADARPAYMGPGVNGFPPMMPQYGAEMMQPGNFDNYGRPGMAYGPVETYPPYGNNFGPSASQSFRGSQSSGHPDENVMYQPYPRNGHRNGATGHGEPDGHMPNQQGRMLGHPEYPRMMPGGSYPYQMPREDNGDGVLGYLQQQFGNAELADCTLELRYVDDRAPPVRIPGHRVVFARSGTLANKVKNQLHQVSDRGMQILLMETKSNWIRSDSFYMAVQRLYGHPLLPLPPRRDRAEASDITDAGTSIEQLDFALSYAAAGHLLEWGPVVVRGCEVATQLLSWQTMEKILEFALDESIDTGSHLSYKFGEASRLLLNAVVTFIVHNIPPTFSLDTTSEHPREYARLPECPPLPAASKKRAPVIARGSSVQIGTGRRSQQLTGIQFGDMSLGDEASVSDSLTPKAAQQAQPVPHAVLSRALINLPFSQLKMILESAGSGNVNGWANSEIRHRIIRSTVEEREARRLRTLDAVLRGRIKSSLSIRSALCGPSPRDMGPWGALGWQEEILPYGNANGPSLGRRWAPYAEPGRNLSSSPYP